MALLYLSTLNQYLGKYSFFTLSEIDEADSLEKSWHLSQPRYSTSRLLEIFPEAKPIIVKNLKAQIEKAKEMILNLISDVEIGKEIFDAIMMPPLLLQ